MRLKFAPQSLTVCARANKISLCWSGFLASPAPLRMWGTGLVLHADYRRLLSPAQVPIGTQEVPVSNAYDLSLAPNCESRGHLAVLASCSVCRR